MKVFSILEAPDGKPEGVTFVPEGFSYPAFVATFLWAFWHRMWVVGLLLFVLTAVLALAVDLEWLGAGLAALLQFAAAVIFAFEARSLQLASLEAAGFRRAGLIQATSMEAAELTYFAGRAPSVAVPEPAPTRFRAGPDDTLGIFGNV